MSATEVVLLVALAFAGIVVLIAYAPIAWLSAVPGSPPRVHVPRPGAPAGEPDPAPPFATRAEVEALAKRVDRLESLEAQRERMR